MVQKIAIIPDELRGVANQFKSKSYESRNIYQMLDNAVKSIQMQWEGMAAQKFYFDYLNCKVQMQKHSELLNNIGLELHGIADEFQRRDEELANR
jgi:WXG100 family type VII secretion target